MEIYQDIKKREEELNVTLTDEQRQQMFRYIVEEVYKPAYTPEEIVSRIEKACPEDVRKYGSPLVKNPERRKLQKKQSEQLRSKYLEYSIFMSERGKYRISDGNMERSFNILMKPLQLGNTPQEKQQIENENHEIGKLFVLHNTENRHQFDDLVNKEAQDKGISVEEAKTELRRSRTEMLRKRLKETKEMMDNLDEMMVPQADFDTMNKNFWKLVWGLDLISELNSMMKHTKNKNLFDLTEEDMKLADGMADQLNKASFAANTIAAMSNASYEYINIDKLQHFDGDFTDLSGTASNQYSDMIITEGRTERKHDKLMKNPDVKGKAAFMMDGKKDIVLQVKNADKEHKDVTMRDFFKAYNKEMHICDNFVVFSRDYGFAIDNRNRYIMEQYVEINKKFGNDKPQPIKDANVPFAIEKDGNTFVLSADNGKYTIDRPEALYNYSLRDDAGKIMEEMKKAKDFWADAKLDTVLSNSPFNKIRTQIKAIYELGKLKPGARCARHMAALENLEIACVEYKSFKEEERRKHPERKISSAQMKREQFADKMLEFAKRKVEELYKVENARSAVAKSSKEFMDKLADAVCDKEAKEYAGGGMAAMRGILGDDVFKKDISSCKEFKDSRIDIAAGKIDIKALAAKIATSNGFHDALNVSLGEKDYTVSNAPAERKPHGNAEAKNQNNVKKSKIAVKK